MGQYFDSLLYYRLIISCGIIIIIFWKKGRGRRGHDCMVVGFITTYAISVLSPLTLLVRIRSGEMYSIQHYVIKFVSDLRQVNKTDRHDITVILLKVALLLLEGNILV